MANEVEITITGRDLTGPAFASVEGRLARLRAEAKALSKELGDLNVGVDINRVGPALAALRAKIASLGIADLADVNVPVGRLTFQMQLLKRLVQQAGLSDMLGINMNSSQLETQLSKLRGMSERIPVSWDVAAFKMPTLGPSQNINDKFSIMGLDAAAAQLAATRAQTTLLLAAFTNLINSKDRLQQDVDTKLTPSVRNVGGWFGWARGRTELFAGALTAIGVPAILASASALHLAIDAAIEFVAVIIPAAVAFAAFGVAAIPTAQNIYLHLHALQNTTTALNENIFPLTGGFQKLANAVQPQVYQLFGEALVVINHNTGLFTRIAVAAGKALQELGARSAVALTSGGMNFLLKQGPHDLAVIGNIIGNIFGTIGNILHTIPGYAQVLLTALDNLSKGLEAISASPITMWLLRVGLLVHGFILWVGLAVTGAVLLGNALLGLAAKFGLVDAGMTVFNAQQFGMGIKQMIGGTGLLAGEMVTLGAGEDIAAAGALTLEGAWAAITAINPIVWIAAIAAGLAVLISEFGRASSATSAYDNALKGALASMPVSQLGNQLMIARVTTTRNLAEATKQLDTVQKFVNVDFRGAQVKVLSDAYMSATANAAGYKDELGTLRGFQANYNTLLKAAHGNLGLLNAAGITSNDIISASTQDMKQYVIEVQAAADAQKALALGVGRAAAAQNAQTNAWMTDGLPAMQAVNTAEDNLINMILGAPQAFIAFAQGLKTMATDAGVAGAHLSGLNTQSLTLANDFYTTAVPAAQSLIDKLDQQSISTKNLTTVVATEVKQMLPFTKGNIEARSVLVDLINNALGPGTVSLKTLNSWVGQNSTTMKGLNSIIAATTISAGNLAGVMKQDAVKSFQAALFATSGADGAIKQYTKDILNNQTQTSKGRSDRQQLIKDLEAAGFSARDAKTFVDKMQGSINALHGKNVNVSVTGSAGGKLTVQSQALGKNAAGFLEFHEAGGIAGTQGVRKLPGFGGGDQVPAMLEPGETIIDKQRSRQFAWLFGLMGVKGYASGGRIPDPNIMTSWASNSEVSFARFVEQSWGNTLLNALKAAVAAAAKAAASAGSGAVGGGSAQNIALGHSMFRWPQSMWPAMVALWNRESGWNRFARNPSSGAYGIPQALPPTKMPFAAQAAGGSHAGAQIGWGYGYIGGRYGNPLNAWAHELRFGWYDQGGWLRPGANMMWNGTGRPEKLVPDRGSGSTVLEVVGGSGEFEAFMAKFIRNYVRVRGGDVQTVFGWGKR